MSDNDLPPTPSKRPPVPMSAQQGHFEGLIKSQVRSPRYRAQMRREEYGDLTRGQILAACWNNAVPWRGQEPARTEPMTVAEAEAYIAGLMVHGQGGRAYVAVKEVHGRTVPLRFKDTAWEATGYDLYQGRLEAGAVQEAGGLLDRVLAQVRETGSVDRLPQS
ncbi:hypothetical protein ACIQNU_04590 [Streptomyces sp. NPDC091292]|uniref:hypothetical protein n=1 Tax=Streptomyces sp. NPDC091292 TaxID=3365991 RepID=UPI00381ECD85